VFERTDEGEDARIKVRLNDVDKARFDRLNA
jgi:hypothetical protein